MQYQKQYVSVLGRIAYMEAIVQPVTWDEWSPQTRSFFERLRSPEGETMILEQNPAAVPRARRRTPPDAHVAATTADRRTTCRCRGDRACFRPMAR